MTALRAGKPTGQFSCLPFLLLLPDSVFKHIFLFLLALFPSCWLLVFFRWCSLLWGVLLKHYGGCKECVCVWGRSYSWFGDKLLRNVSNAIFLSLWFCYRPATELFEAHSMREMTFNPPVASVTPRRKVPSHLSSPCPFLTTWYTSINCICWLSMQYSDVSTLSLAFWFLYFLCQVFFLLTGIRKHDYKEGKKAVWPPIACINVARWMW